MISICISLTNDFEHLIMCLLAICMSSLVEYLLEMLSIFKIGLLGFFIIEF